MCFALRSTHGAVDFGEPYIFFFLLCIFFPLWIPVEEFWGEIINNGLLSVPTFTPIKHFVCVGRSRIPNSADVSTASETACWFSEKVLNNTLCLAFFFLPSTHTQEAIFPETLMLYSICLPMIYIQFILQLVEHYPRRASACPSQPSDDDCTLLRMQLHLVKQDI